MHDYNPVLDCTTAPQADSKSQVVSELMDQELKQEPRHDQRDIMLASKIFNRVEAYNSREGVLHMCFILLYYHWP